MYRDTVYDYANAKEIKLTESEIDFKKRVLDSDVTKEDLVDTIIISNRIISFIYPFIKSLYQYKERYGPSLGIIIGSKSFIINK
jgi:hypothetical protein